MSTTYDRHRHDLRPLRRTPSSSEVEAIAGRHAPSASTSRPARVTVEGDGFSDEQVAAAVDEAGYALA